MSANGGSLRDLMNRRIAGFLPQDGSSVTGSALLPTLLADPHFGKYSEKTIRYHLSNVSADRSSPIQKVASGQGYQLRTQDRRIEIARDIVIALTGPLNLHAFSRLRDLAEAFNTADAAFNVNGNPPEPEPETAPCPE